MFQGGRVSATRRFCMLFESPIKRFVECILPPAFCLLFPTSSCHFHEADLRRSPIYRSSLFSVFSVPHFVSNSALWHQRVKSFYKYKISPFKGLDRLTCFKLNQNQPPQLRQNFSLRIFGLRIMVLGPEVGKNKPPEGGRRV